VANVNATVKEGSKYAPSNSFFARDHPGILMKTGRYETALSPKSTQF
jgi:hypothetical protein